jgi:hypothetical protein
VMTKQGVTSLAVVTARHRRAPVRGAFRSIRALVVESGGAWLRCVRSSVRWQNSVRAARMLHSDSLLRGGLVIYPQGQDVSQGIHAVAVDE